MEVDRGGEDFCPVDLVASRDDFLAVDLVRPHRGVEEAFGGIVETGAGEMSLLNGEFLLSIKVS